MTTAVAVVGGVDEGVGEAVAVATEHPPEAAEVEAADTAHPEAAVAATVPIAAAAKGATARHRAVVMGAVRPTVPVPAAITARIAVAETA